MWKLFLLHSSLPEAWVPSRFPCLSVFFFFPSFSQPGCVEISLPFFGNLKVFCQHAVGVLWKLFHMQVYFFLKIYLLINR